MAEFYVRYCCLCAGDRVVGRNNFCTGVSPDNALVPSPSPIVKTPMKTPTNPRAIAVLNLFPRGRDDLADMSVADIYKVLDKHLGKQRGRLLRPVAQNLRKSTRSARKVLSNKSP